MQLSDFFSPLNIYNLSVFLAVFFILDAVGFKFAGILKPPPYLRMIYWIWGLGIFIFIWFFLHFFLPFWSSYLWLSLIILSMISVPSYIKNKGFLGLIKSVLRFPYPFILLIIALKPLYFLFSAPPYYGDEMIYQFYSPARILMEKNWVFLASINSIFSPNLYEMIPKFLNESYWMMFSLTKTYATARLLHFLIVFSAIYAVSAFIKEKIGLLAGISYLFFSLYLSAYFLHFSTLGYVDAGSAAFAILFLITVVDLILSKKSRNFYISASVFGLTVGMKYTILVFVVSIILIGAILARNMLRKFFKKNYSGKLFFAAVLFLIFGGFWYLKNLIMSGNPIYPFFFKCLHSWKCTTGTGFFTGWTLPLRLENFTQIRNIIFQNSNIFYYFTLISLTSTVIISKILKIRLILFSSSLVFLSVITEILLSKNISGFELRYYFHWLLLIPLILIFPLGLISRIKDSNTFLKRIVFTAWIFTLFFTVGPVVYRNIKRLYEGDFVYGYVRNYAAGRINLDQWLDYYYPQMSDFVKWCGKKDTMKDVLVIDPGLIWTSNEEYVKVFLVNCNLITNVASDYSDPQKVLVSVKTKYPKSYIVSVERCDKNRSYKNANTDPYIVSRYEANQEVICAASEIFKNLYILKD